MERYHPLSNTQMRAVHYRSDRYRELFETSATFIQTRPHSTHPLSPKTSSLHNEGILDREAREQIQAYSLASSSVIAVTSDKIGVWKYHVLDSFYHFDRG